MLSKFIKYGLLFIIVLFVAGIISVGAIFYAYSRNLPDIKQLENWKPSQVTQVYAADGSLITEFFLQRRQYVSIDKIPDYVKKAFIAIEDRTFYSNPGIDVWGILRAAFTNITSGRIVAGGSTISQQLIKNLFLTPERSFRRKIKEMILAIKLNQIYPKDKILEMYLNQIYLGHGAYGVEAASQVYFGKHVWQLDICEAAVLAGLPKAPSKYDPYKNIKLAESRRNAVLQAMVEEDYLDIETAKKCSQQPIKLKTAEADEGNIHDYFTETVRLWFVNHFGSDTLYKGGYKIYTTADPDLLRDMHFIVKDHLEDLQYRVGFPKLTKEEIKFMTDKYNKQNIKSFDDLKTEGVYVGIIEKIKKHTIYFNLGEINGEVKFFGSLRKAKKGYPIYVRYIGNGQFEFVPYLETAAISVDPKTGAIKALVGGYDFEKSKFNRAIQAKRQPGSSFKPIVYTAAILNGYTEISIVKDEPVSIWDPQKGEEWTPRNYEKEYNGEVTVREALTRSLNAAAVNTLLEVGYNPVISLAYKMGIKTKLLKVPSLALGSIDVSPIEMATVYSTFANNGVKCEPYFIEKVIDSNGNIVYQHTPQCQKVIPEDENSIMVDLLQAVVQEGTGVRAKILGFPVAGKTGTTNDYTDAWFAGFSTKLTTVVWVGYDYKKTIGRKMTGSKAALPIWIDIMATAHTDKEIPGFTHSPNTYYLPIDLSTRAIATENCRAKKILFIKGTEPMIDCEGNIIVGNMQNNSDNNFLYDIKGE